MPSIEDLELDDFRLDPDLARRLLSPALVIDLVRVRRNVDRILDCTGGPDRWRPHVKTTKSPVIWRELVERGVRQFKCATVREARALAQMLATFEPAGGDVLMAHPAQGPALAQLGALARAHPETRFSVLSEDPRQVELVPSEVAIFVDLNPGYDRTGLGLSRRQEILAVAKSAGARLRGLHHYEGQLTDADLDQRRAKAFAGYEELLQLVAEIEALPGEVGELITSGTPGFRCALEFEAFGSSETPLHRVSPGTVVFHDWRSQEQNPDLQLEPAAVLFTRVISQPERGRFTCDAGSKSIAAEAGHPCAFAIGHPEFRALVPSEEHLPFRSPEELVPERGTELYLVPRHICPTVNLAEQALLLDGEGGFELLSIEARAHDLWFEDNERPAD